MLVAAVVLLECGEGLTEWSRGVFQLLHMAGDNVAE